MEFLEVLVSTISGFIIGFFAEPVKIYFSNRNRRNDLRKSLYEEMVHNYVGLKQLLKMIEEEKIHISQILPNFVHRMKFDCYDYAKSAKSVVIFYRLNEANEIDIINRNFKWVSDEWLKTDKERFDYASAAIKVFEDKVANGKIDKSLLEKASHDQLTS